MVSIKQVLPVILVLNLLQSELRVGLNGGYVHNDFNIHLHEMYEITEYFPIDTWSAGILIEQSLIGDFSILVNPRYITKGSLDKSTSTEMWFHIKEQLEYIEIPLMLRYSLPLDKWQFYLSAGIFYGFLIYRTEIWDDSYGNHSENHTDGPREKNDYGYMVATGLQFPIGPALFFVEGRGTRGLLNIDIRPDWDVDIKTATLEILAGVSFRIVR